MCGGVCEAKLKNGQSNVKLHQYIKQDICLLMSSQTRLPRSCAVHVFMDITSYDKNNRPYVTHAYNYLTVTNVVLSHSRIYKDLGLAMAACVKRLIPSEKANKPNNITGFDVVSGDDPSDCLCDDHEIIEENVIDGMDITSNRIKLPDLKTRVDCVTLNSLHDRLKEFAQTSTWVKTQSRKNFFFQEIEGNTTNDFIISTRCKSRDVENRILIKSRAGKFVINLANVKNAKHGEDLPQQIVTSCPSLNVAVKLYNHDITMTAVCSKGSQFKPFHFIANAYESALPLDRITHASLLGHSNLPFQRYKYQWTKAVHVNHNATYKEMTRRKADCKDTCMSLTRSGVLVTTPLRDEGNFVLVTFCLGNCKWNTAMGAKNVYVSRNAAE